MVEKVVEVRVYTGDVYEGILVQSDPDKIVVNEWLTGSRIRIYSSSVVSVRTLGWQEVEVGV